MDEVKVIQNKWEHKEWRDPAKYRVTPTKIIEDDSTPFIKKATAKDIVITYNRANRIKTLRGIRR
jgi:hypothetical protein